MIGIHQIIAAAAPGDAVTNAAIELRNVLRRVGPSEVYARHLAPELVGEVKRIDDYAPEHFGDVLVYHASIGEPQLHAFLLSRREPLVLIYHNVTPAQHFERWDARFAELLALGRSELVALRHRVSIAVAVSDYNALELAAMGYQDVRIVPPVLDPFRLLDVEPNPSTLNHLDNALGAPFLLYVGQLLPHKRPDLLVEAMHIAATYLNFEPYLLLVGHARLSRYHQAIAEQIRELNLPNVHLVGSVSTEDLAAYYRRAMAVVTASEHEGFCVPLVEAMAFGNPVIARACGAIPETLADGGLCLPADAGPELFAEAFFAVTHDNDVRNDLTRRARERAEIFRVDRAKEDLLSVLLEVV